MSDLEEFEAMNKAYVEILSGLLGDEPLPARTTFQAGKLLFGAR
jgi:enamine deaminase RidA (YjgF/YER057c/UK114 family)